MAKAFLSENSDPLATSSAPVVHREKVKILVIGSTLATQRVIHEFSRIGFSDTVEWSRPLPTHDPDESMRILTRYVVKSEQSPTADSNPGRHQI